MKRSIVVLAALCLAGAGLSGCATVKRLNPIHLAGAEQKKKAEASRGQRVSILAFDQKLAVADTLKGADFYLPEPKVMADWPLPGGTPEQSVEHVAAAPDFALAWKRRIGEGSNKKYHVTAPPVSAGGKIFVMDGDAEVSARSADSGADIWRVNVAHKTKRDKEAFGGGLAYADGKLFVTSGYRFVAALDASTGKELWRTATDGPIHSAPTVAAGRVLAIDTDNQLLSFDMATGQAGWTYQGLVEPARILQASSPAVSGDTVVAAFASGEVIAFKAANGNDLWTQALSQSSRTNALSEIRDIAGRPVIYRGDVFAGSHSGVFAAIDFRTGQARWSLPVSSITTPWAAGDVVYVVSQAGEVICVARESGQVYWITELNKAPPPETLTKKHWWSRDKTKNKDITVWSGVVLASNRLITVSSKGEAVALNPKTGAVEKTIKIGSPALMTPIAVGNMLYVVTEDGDLAAIR